MKNSLLPLRVVLLMLPLLLPAAAWAQSGSSTTVTVAPNSVSNSTLVVDPGKVGTWTLQAVSGYHIVSSDYSVNPDSTIWTGSNPVYKAMPGPNSIDDQLAAQVKGLLAPDGLPGGGGSGPPPTLTFTANLDVVKADLDADTDGDDTITHSDEEDTAEDESPGLVLIIPSALRPPAEYAQPVTLEVTRRPCIITWSKSSDNLTLYADVSCTNTTLPTNVGPGAAVTVYALGVAPSPSAGADWIRAQCRPTSAVDGTNEVATDQLNVTVPNIFVRYQAGTDPNNGSNEVPERLESDYLLKGYMLELSTPPVQAGTPVVWTAKKHGNNVGSWHPSLTWVDYANPLAATPTGQTVCWRSDSLGSIDDQYMISATYTPQGGTRPITVPRGLLSRLLSPESRNLQIQFNDDVDMLQRLLIQLFYMDKGRLSSYRPGKYDLGKLAGYYVSSLPGRTVPKWSAVADEVWNFDKFAIGNRRPSDRLNLPTLQGMWEQFDLILAAPLPNATSDSSPGFPGWINNAIAVSGITIPPPDPVRGEAAFPRTPQQLLTKQVRKEGGRHSYNQITPLAVSNLQIGENIGGRGDDRHTFTDGGIGFAKIQPYNRRTYNIYRPQENLTVQALMMRGWLDGAAGDLSPSEKVWRSLFAYNNGSYRATLTMPQLRAGHGPPGIQGSAAYADAIFGLLGVPLP